MTVCRTGKKDWPTREEALDRLAEIQASELNRPGRTTPTRVYQCEFCQQFHMTHSDKRKGRR